MDLLLTTNEQILHGPISLNGSREGTEITWHLSPAALGFSTRPNFCDGFLAEYERGKELAEHEHAEEAIIVWQGAASHYAPQVFWLRGWLAANAAQIFTKSRKWAQVDEQYQLAVAGIKDSLPAAAASWGIWWAWTYDQRNDPVAAEQTCVQALSLAQQGGNHVFLQVSLLSYAAKLADDQGNSQSALSYLDQLNELDKGSPPHGIRSAFAFALHYAIVGDLDKAEQYYRQGLVKSRISNPEYAFLMLHGLGAIAGDRGDYVTALRLLDESLAIGQQLYPNSYSLSMVLEVMGIAARETGDLRRARDCFEQAMVIAQKFSQRNIAVARNLNHLAILLEHKKDLAGAERYLRNALDVALEAAPRSREAAWIYTDLGGLLMSRGSLPDAGKNYENALQILNTVTPKRLEMASTLAALADIKRRTGELETAAEYFRRFLAVMDTQASRLGGSANARAGFRAKYEDYYREYADLLVAQNKLEEAFAVIERSRARTLLETLNAARINVQSGANKELLEHEGSLLARINAKSEHRARLLAAQHTAEQIKAVEKEISDLTTEYQDVEGQIRSTSPAYAALTQPQPLTAKEIQQQLLDEDTMLLEYSLGEERSFVFAVTPDSIHAYELPKKAEIEQQARKVHRLLTAQRTAVRGESLSQRRQRMAHAQTSFDRAVVELSPMVLGPLAGQLNNKRLLIVTDGALAYVPFSLLPEPRAPDAAASNGEPVPLIVNHEIVNLPSASVLAVLRQQQRQRKPAPKTVAVLADPVFDRHDPRLGGIAAPKAAAAPQTRSAKRDSLDELLASDFSSSLLTRSATDLGLARGGRIALPRLRFSRQEADAILAVTPAGKGLEAVDFSANRATALNPELSQYRIIHFATHGLLNSEHPELSGLVLSLVDKKGKPQNGFLTLQDIYNLNLPADLVVLSACETGLGKEISGEGLIGLTRGFMYAGATRVVASLWKVSDAATAQLMAEFYRGMEKDGLPPAAALRAAQIAMWKQTRWRHPYYWAAFQIQGEWK
ncbi:MAG TPA: CHAT domain-containing tetratricopeptide repeat protein [Candidatus Angelobacter sp.]